MNRYRLTLYRAVPGTNVRWASMVNATFRSSAPPEMLAKATNAVAEIATIETAKPQPMRRPDEYDEIEGLSRWCVDGYPTHGEQGLACVYSEPDNGEAPGPDYELDGNAEQVCSWLYAGGFTRVITDNRELAEVWTEHYGADTVSLETDYTGPGIENYTGLEPGDAQ